MGGARGDGLGLGTGTKDKFVKRKKTFMDLENDMGGVNVIPNTYAQKKTSVFPLWPNFFFRNRFY